MDPFIVNEIISRALAEDIGHGDITTQVTVDPEAEGKAIIVAKEDMVLCGHRRIPGGIPYARPED